MSTSTDSTVRRGRKRTPPEERFERHVEPGPPPQEGTLAFGGLPCLLFSQQETKNPYPTFRDGEKVVFAHQFVALRAFGPTPKGHHIDHLCGIRNCVEVTHLEIVTAKENCQRYWRTKRYREEHGLPPLKNWINPSPVPLDDGDPQAEVLEHDSGKKRQKCRPIGESIGEHPVRPAVSPTK